MFLLLLGKLGCLFSNFGISWKIRLRVVIPGFLKPNLKPAPVALSSSKIKVLLLAITGKVNKSTNECITKR